MRARPRGRALLRAGSRDRGRRCPAGPTPRCPSRGFASRVDAAELAGELPTEDVTALRRSRYLGLSVPQVHGGLALSLRERVEAQLELARGSASTAKVAGDLALELELFGRDALGEFDPRRSTD